MVGGAHAHRAPSTTLRVVPLSRSVSRRGSGQTTASSRRDASELCQPPRRRRRPVFGQDHAQKIREAERREAHPTMAASFDAARALAKARSPFGAPRRRLPRRPNARTRPRPRFTRTERRRGRYPRRHSRLSRAPGAPVLMPAGHSSLDVAVCISANCVNCIAVCISANCVHLNCVDAQAARERSYELRPQEPHPLRFRDRLEKAIICQLTNGPGHAIFLPLQD